VFGNISINWGMCQQSRVNYDVAHYVAFSAMTIMKIDFEIGSSLKIEC